MILVLWPNHSNKPLKTCWKCLLNRPAVLYGNYLNTTSNKIYKWSFVYELQILVYNHVRLVKLGFLSHECDWLWTTGWPGFHPSIIYFCCHFCLPFSLSSTSKVPSSPFFPSSFLLLCYFLPYHFSVTFKCLPYHCFCPLIGCNGMVHINAHCSPPVNSTDQQLR